MRRMDCDALAAAMAAYVDGELVGEDRDAFETHVRQCASCRGAVEGDQELMARMRAVGPLHRAAADLRASVADVLTASTPAAPRRETARARHRAVLAAAVLVALAVGTGISLWRERSSRPLTASAASSEFAALGVDTHLRHFRGQLPLEVRSERPREVAGWFAGRVPFQLALPDYPLGVGERKPYTLVGGRLVAFHGDYAAYVAYRMEDRPISLLVTSAAAVQPEGGVTVTSGSLRFHLESVAGLKVITWTDRGLTYALVSDLREDGAQSCLVCHGTEQERRKLEGLRQGSGT